MFIHVVGAVEATWHIASGVMGASCGSAAKLGSMA
jgi:hypothetical protein